MGWSVEGLDVQVASGPSYLHLADPGDDGTTAFDLRERIDHLQQVRVGVRCDDVDHGHGFSPSIGLYGDAMFGHSPLFATSLYGIEVELSGGMRLGGYSSVDIGLGVAAAVMHVGYRRDGGDRSLLTGAYKSQAHVGFYPLDIDRARIGVRVEVYGYAVDTRCGCSAEERGLVIQQYGMLVGMEAAVSF